MTGFYSEMLADELDENGAFVDGVRPHIGNYVNYLIDLKDDHRSGDNCRSCKYAAEAGADGWMCFASLGPVSDEYLDHWVKHGARNDSGYPDFYDFRETRDGRRRWDEYVEKDNEEYRRLRAAMEEEFKQ
jgi:hypothetical protein